MSTDCLNKLQFFPPSAPALTPQDACLVQISRALLREWCDPRHPHSPFVLGEM